ncbi:DUF2510 domain-containing protein [Williamsia herbipolensis]|uniref:DUF2510 domain-containing protein n=1 Tax=Williamsia herbipolensis TaxID=1603258 RepID=A0AAU4K055_9NOCA|nr:DUF2510 domain-containing protein [Williamsia herbipolensis]
MGFTRKLMSVTSMGLVDYRSDKERTAAYTRGVRKQARKQTKIMKNQAANPGPTYVAQPAPTHGGTWPPPGTAIPQPPAAAPSTAPAGSGWFPDQSDPSVLRYFDGTSWTEHTAPASAPPPPQ